jgi:DNA-binding MarR family transcriptional regulator
MLASCVSPYPAVARTRRGGSALSNVVKRFEQRGWVERSPDPDDGRYTIAALTDSGYDVVVAAAPMHVRSVELT